jgi:hypothetical protein
MASTVPALYLGVQTAGTVSAEWDGSELNVRSVE